MSLVVFLYVSSGVYEDGEKAYFVQETFLYITFDSAPIHTRSHIAVPSRQRMKYGLIGFL